MIAKTLSVFVDYYCNYNCDHCSVKSNRLNKNPLPIDVLKKILDEGEKLGFKLVAFTGGEPTLDLDQLIEMINYAKAKRYITRVISNGWWARNEKSAFEMVEKLKDAGLDELNISFDDFHMDLGKGRWNASESNLINATKVVLAVNMKFGIGIIKKKGSLINKDYVIRLLSDNLGISKEDINNKIAFIEDVAGRTGRGRETLSEEEIEYRDFPITGCADIGTAYAVHPTGRITACCGHATFDTNVFDVSNWKDSDTSLKDAVDYTTHNLIYWWIWAVGPQKILKTLGINVKTSHICDACSILMTKYKDLLIEYYRQNREDILVNDIILNSRASETIQLTKEKGFISD